MRSNISRYQVSYQEEIQLLVSPDLAPHTRQLHLDVRKFLFFFNQLQADAELLNGAHLGRDLSGVTQ